MTFAFIGKITDFYLSLHYHFLEKNHHIQIFTTVDALLNETFSYHYNALIIDYDSYPSAYNQKLIQFLTILSPEIPIILLVNKKTNTTNKLLSSGIIDCLEKTLPIQEMIMHICDTSHIKAVPPKQQTTTLQIGKDYEFDMQSSVLRYKKNVQPLMKKEIAFFHLLIKNGDEFTTLADIVCCLYPNESKIKDVAIRSLIMRLRKKLQEEIIETYPRYGYRLKF
jgi:DNA-binding response OmpR family regulator